MTRSRQTMQLISTFLIILFIFQFIAPITQTGIAHTPKECKKLLDKYNKKYAKAVELTTKLDNLKKDQVYTIVKDTLWDATLGGLFTGATAWAILRNTLKNAFSKIGLAAFVGLTLKGAIDHYNETQDEIDKVKEKRDKINEETKALWKKYLECMDHTHASGSLSPYMNDDIYLAYGDTHYASFSASIAFHTVYWYVKGPDQTGYGTLMNTDSGNGSNKNSLFSFSAPHTVGTYTITAHVYFTDTILDFSYDVYVSN